MKVLCSGIRSKSESNPFIHPRVSFTTNQWKKTVVCKESVQIFVIYIVTDNDLFKNWDGITAYHGGTIQQTCSECVKKWERKPYSTESHLLTLHPYSYIESCIRKISMLFPSVSSVPNVASTSTLHKSCHNIVNSEDFNIRPMPLKSQNSAALGPASCPLLSWRYPNGSNNSAAAIYRGFNNSHSN